MTVQNQIDGRDELDWDLLIRRIAAGRCTPFIGAGACHGTLPLGAQIAAAWARQHGYPLQDSGDLARVSQFLAVKKDAQFPKELIVQEYFRRAAAPNFGDEDQLHRVLAELPFPIYVTTNYDDFMVQALQAATSTPKRPKWEVCRWNRLLLDQPSHFDSDPTQRDCYEPSPEQPLVFHLHGHHSITDSLVLTEDDYLDFLINLSRNDAIVPARIQKAFSATSLMFIGYSLNDWDFRVLFRGLSTLVERSQTRKHVSVQLAPWSDDASRDHQREQDYLSRYFQHQSIQVYWGSCAAFSRELRSRWKRHNHGD